MVLMPNERRSPSTESRTVVLGVQSISGPTLVGGCQKRFREPANHSKRDRFVRSGCCRRAAIGHVTRAPEPVASMIRRLARTRLQGNGIARWPKGRDRFCALAPVQAPPSDRWGAPVVAMKWPTVEGRATPCRRPQSNQVPPWRARSSVGTFSGHSIVLLSRLLRSENRLRDHAVDALGAVDHLGDMIIDRNARNHVGLLA
jgi:hypothetical protein